MADDYTKPRITQASLVAAVAIIQVVLTLIIAPLATWGLARIVDYGERIAMIESNRMTEAEARVVISNAATSAAKAASEVVERSATSYRQDQQALDTRLRAIERSLDRVLVKLGDDATKAPS